MSSMEKTLWRSARPRQLKILTLNRELRQNPWFKFIGLKKKWKGLDHKDAFDFQNHNVSGHADTAAGREGERRQQKQSKRLQRKPKEVLFDWPDQDPVSTQCCALNR